MQQNGTKELPEVFKELQNIRSMQNQIKAAKKVHKTISEISNLALEKTIVLATVLVCALIITPSISSSFAVSDVQLENTKPLNSFEANENILNMHNIISENTGLIETKQLITEIREFDFEIEYKENNLLPLGEEKIVQQGIKGKENVTAVQTYKNDECVEEKIIEKEKVSDSVIQIVEKGTSKYLANKKMHIGDTIYVTENILLLKAADDTSDFLAEIKESLDVKLLGLEGEFCKVLYDGKEGYIDGSKLTSAA